jgi:parallel beta-helix repeat protein
MYPEIGDRRMRREAALAIACLLFCSLFAFLTQNTAGWAFFHHGGMAKDALVALGWVEEEVIGIPGYANQVDDPILGLPHNHGSCHRVEKYQREFELYDGEVCTFMGAESWAAGFASLAETAYASGDIEQGKKNLGYAIHFIQDALCPPHVFPFSENPIYGLVSFEFEFHALTSYNALGSDWPTLVESAQPEWITGTEDLRQKVKEAADWVNATFQPPQCSYVRQDGATIGTLFGTKWDMADEDIGECMQKAAGLVKGAAKWAHPHAQIRMPIYIRGDGSIDPPAAPISTADNILYTLTDNINADVGVGAYGIVIMRDNIIIDGNGFTVQGTQVYLSGGIYLSGRENVTIRNTQIKAFYDNIYLVSSSSNSIIGNNITLSVSPTGGDGIHLVSSSYNTIRGNNITYNQMFGIYLVSSSSYNIISGNNIMSGHDGIVLGDNCNYNSIGGNRLGLTHFPLTNGITLGVSSNHNTVSENNITCAGYGIALDSSWDNVFWHNNVVAGGVYTVASESNVWDDGYPSGGNYWSDYAAADVYWGPYQNQTGSDGIRDTPYMIDANNTDNYPLMSPYEYWKNPITGDINKDMEVDSEDLFQLAVAYGSTSETSNWNPNCDIEKDNKVDVSDLFNQAKNYGKTTETAVATQKTTLASLPPILAVLLMLPVSLSKRNVRRKAKRELRAVNSREYF